MKKIYKLFIGITLLFPLCLLGQTGFNYNAVLRDNSGTTLNEQDVSVTFSIFQNYPNGTLIYQEEHSTKTNASGGVSLEIGKGCEIKGMFAKINWSNPSYFVETLIKWGEGYTISGTQEVLSVPYAQYAQQAGGLKNTNSGGQTYLLTVDDLGKLQSVKMPKGYTNLVFQDEFNGIGLPDSNKWGYEIGFKRNKELQYYTKECVENIFQKDGFLNIRCNNRDTIKDEQGQILNRRIVSKDGQLLEKLEDGAKEYFITSASIMSKDKGDWTYCRVESRIKIAMGSGTWPAVWMLPTSTKEYGYWPNSGEIDIMEYIGNEPDIYHCALHCLETHTGNKRSLDNVSDWHVVALEWHEDSIIWYIDDQIVFRHTKRAEYDWKKWPFDQPFYLILNLAFGGGWGGDKNTRFDTSILPQTYQVDYVRVFQ